MIRGTTRVAAVLGWPIEHSRSPMLLNAAFEATGIDAVLVPIAVPPDGLATVVAALRAMRALGASVTVPHKVAVAASCDELAAEAAAIGAVNCLQVDRGRIVGHNTDAGGFADALAGCGFAVPGTRCVLLGAGGSARAIAYGLAGADVEVVARREAAWTAVTPWTRLRDAFDRADLVVDCTPTGLDDGERTFVDTLPLDALRPGALVASLIYHRTPLLLARAKQRNHPILDGRSMLVHQAARAFTIWTGRSAPVETMQATFV
jgi:shikimate dehydrogenase